MKLNRFLSIAAAALAVFASCGEKDNPIQGEASLTIKSETAVTVGTETESVDIEFVATRDWTAKSDAAWASVDPASGSASSDAQKVTVTVLPNDGYARDAKITLSIGTLKKTVSIHQEGSGAAPDGTKDNPFDVVSAIAKCVEIGQTQSSESYYVKGIVSSIKNTSGVAKYGNIDFYISDDGQDAKETRLLVFQCLYLNGEKFTAEDQVKVGDKVVVYGPLVNYMGNTPETGGKGSTRIVKHNDKEGEAGGSTGELKTEPKGTGTEADPFNAAAAIKKAVEVGQTASAEQYYIKGKIVSFKEAFSAQFGNMTFYISDDGTAALDQFLVFRVLSYNGEKFVSGDQLKVGDEVVVKAAIVNYYGNTPETNQGGHLISVNGGQTVSDYMSISNNYAEVTAAAGSLEITVTANQSWSVVSDSDFAKVSPAEGTGDGKVKLEYTANGNTARTAKITFTAKDGKTAVFTLRQLEEGAVAAQEITWKAADWEKVSAAEFVLKQNGYTITIKKEKGVTNPLPKDGEFRAYAGASVNITSETEFSYVEFAITPKGLYRLPAITADNGEVAAQAKGDKQVVWTGKTKSVTFTVGDKAIYGSDGEEKAGQFCFGSINIK